MRLQRLFDMSAAELAFRGRQEVFKAVERLSVPGPRRPALPRFDRSAMDATMRSLCSGPGREGFRDMGRGFQKRLQARMSERFFPGLRDDQALREFRRRYLEDFADDARRIVDQADAVCALRFDVLGYGRLSFGRPVNWHLDPVSGRESPRVHWSRIDPLDTGQVGDNKVVWELNRHQWMLDLGQAYRLTDDQKYAECFTALLSQWLERNPYARGINWSSALEVGMRLISWCWALALFRDSPALTPERFQALMAGLQRHAGFVERYLSRYYSPNTHLTVEALALYYAGTLLPELRGAERWRAVGREVLLEQLPIQVSPAGIYFEQSTRYQYYTAEIYLHFAILAGRNDDPLPDSVNERLRAMLGFLLQLRRPDGTLPQIGDTDGGWLCPLVRRAAGDYRGLFSTAALFLEDPHLAWAAGSLTPEPLCLLGAAAGTAWPDLEKASTPPPERELHDAGDYVIMRDGWSPNGHQLIFHTGPLGCPISAGHGHADLLSVQCSAFGENYLVDPGTGCYRADAPARGYFRGTSAHSAVRVDGLDQAETAGPFSWSGRPVVRRLDVRDEPGRLFAAAEHDAYARLASPVIHRRRVWFLDERAWLVVDDLLGDDRHRVDLGFQFAPLPLVEAADGWFRARGKASALLVKSFSDVEVHAACHEGAHEPLRGWYSPNYGQQEPAPALSIGAAGALPLRLATLLIPSRDRDAPPPSVTRRLRAGRLVGLSVNDLQLDLPEFESHVPSKGMEP